MQKLLTVVADLIFPPSADALTIRHATPATVATLYQPGRHQSTLFLSSYQHPLLQAAIRENKFHCNRKATAVLATLLKEWHCTHGTTNTLYVPIPLSRSRERQRGHNQVYSIIQAAGLKEHSATKLLYRKRDTAPQSHLDRDDRVHNMKDALGCRPDRIPNGASHIVIVDDVITTGATMTAAIAAIRPHLPQSASLQLVAITH